MQGDAARQKMGTEGKPEHDGPGQGQGKRRKAWRAKVRKARIKASERQGHWPGKRMVEVVWSGLEREGSHGWEPGCVGGAGQGRGPGRGGRTPRAGPLTCLGCSGAESAVATAYKQREGEAALSAVGRGGRVG